MMDASYVLLIGASVCLCFCCCCTPRYGHAAQSTVLTAGSFVAVDSVPQFNHMGPDGMESQPMLGAGYPGSINMQVRMRCVQPRFHGCSEVFVCPLWCVLCGARLHIQKVYLCSRQQLRLYCCDICREITLTCRQVCCLAAIALVHVV